MGQFKKFQQNELHLSVISLSPELEMTYLGDWGSANMLEEYWTDSMGGMQENQYVKSGQHIGLGGTSGHSTGPHLHFEMRYKDYSFDPQLLIDLSTQQLKTETVIFDKVDLVNYRYPTFSPTIDELEKKQVSKSKKGKKTSNKKKKPVKKSVKKKTTPTNKKPVKKPVSKKAPAKKAPAKKAPAKKKR